MFSRELRFIADYRAAAATAVLSLAALLLVSCDRKAPDQAPANVQTEAPTVRREPAAAAVPVPLPALTRGDLVSAAGRAASAYAEGKPLPTADPLVGRAFTVRIPFGCNGPASAEAAAGEDDGLAGWTWGPDRKTLRLRMAPGDWTTSAMLAKAGASDDWEAVEGFWVPRPWLASESCPAVRSDPLETGAHPSSSQTVGLAAAFEAGGSRVGRRNGRAYEYTVRAKGDEALASPEAGFRMVLEGRLTSFPSGRSIECTAAGPDQRPICIVAIRLDRVAFEDGKGSILSEWRPG
jgi:hypothetical protein